jgi:hypothetical protein
MISVSDRMDDEKIRLADDAFSKICFMINDISVDVRVCASHLLVNILLYIIPCPQTYAIAKCNYCVNKKKG